MKLKTVLIVIVFIGLWFFLKNFKSIYRDFEYSSGEPEGQTVNNKREGEWKTFYSNGKIKALENYKNDTLEGSNFSYGPNGNLRAKSFYHKGIMIDSFIMYHSNGQINLAEWKDEAGKSQGIFKIFYESGRLSQIGKHKDGHLDDTSKTYYENGKIKEIEFYKDRKRNGTWLYYSDEGKLIKKENYLNDSLINAKK
jgi:antitoxin component YwqK of YwqJK toxin-antitoxin module